MMKEWTVTDVIKTIEAKETAIIYLYTPFCGTCQLAERMLNIVDKMIDLHFRKINLNYMPELAKKFAVESVPCLIIIKEGRMEKKLYAFQSVSHLYEVIRPFA